MKWREIYLMGTMIFLAKAQVMWTPINVDGNNQVDMWTARSKGCRCSFDSARQDCACCVQDGGCHCGISAPNRCSQCGIHQYCGKMCNMTIDSRNIRERSGKTYGMIKSQYLEGPAFCWYRLLPEAGHRVEIQIYRLVSVGRYNGSNCESGFVQLLEGTDTTPRPEITQICGSNERFAPPVVLFADTGPATLLFQIEELTLRSQFLAYFSFTATNNSQGLGYQPRGGRRLERTDCDWLYQDVSCRDPISCRLASPGYPGIYSPNKHCKYHITTNSAHTRVRIKFLALYLPHNHCGTDYVSVYQGSSTSSPLLTTLCGNKKQDLVYSGPNLLIEFSSGPLVPPFNYNGFLATLDFWEKVVTTEASAATVSRTTELAVLMDGLSNATGKPPCELVFLGNETRTGHFDTRGLEWSHVCTITFIGELMDIVFVSLFNFKLRSAACLSSIEVYDGFPSREVKPIKRYCSPSVRLARDPSGRFQEQDNVVSSSKILVIKLRRHQPINIHNEVEYLDGAFVFHDEHIKGTVLPSTVCNVDYYGVSSAPRGQVSNYGEETVLWNIEGPLQCSQRFIPMTNQSVTLKISSLNKLVPDHHCHTECGDGGCRCVTNLLPLNRMDHLKILSENGLSIACLCGDFQQEWLPVGLRSWTPLTLQYFVAHYSWTMKGFTFLADYKFNSDAVCGHRVLRHHSGTIQSLNVSTTGQLNYYFYQSCTWVLDSNVERQLNIQLSSKQNRPCTAWNLSIHEYAEKSPDRVGVHLHTFCPREKFKNYSLPFKLNIVVIKLTAMTRTPPEFTMKWRSQVVRANTRTAGPISDVSSAKVTPHCVTMGTLLLQILSLTFR